MASRIKLQIIISITNAIGNAAIMDTVCILDMLLSLKISAIGNKIRRIAQNSLMRTGAFSSPSPMISRYEYWQATNVIESKEDA